MVKQKSVSIIALGCPKNMADAEKILGSFVEQGYQIVSSDEPSDVVIVNTCAFLKSARDEAFEEIENVVKGKKEGKYKKIILAGCLNDYYKGEDFNKFLKNEYPEVDLFIMPDDISPPVGARHAWPLRAGRRVLFSPYTAYLKIADGCSQGCSFCTIPKIRGKYRSRPLDEVVSEAQGLVENGVKEICLVAQDTASFGLEIAERQLLPDLLKKLCKVEGLEWIRIMYAYPELVSREIVDIIEKEPKVCNYLDMPVQHIADDIRDSMRRKSSSDRIKKTIKMLKNAIPEIALRTTFIVGYPGETEEHFKMLLDFVGEIKFTRVGVFTYSPEPGTYAATLAQVPQSIIEDRFHRLMETQRRISKELQEKMVDREVSVLIEKPGLGRTYRDAPEIDGLFYFNNSSGQLGSLAKARVTSARDYDLKGYLLSG